MASRIEAIELLEKMGISFNAEKFIYCAGGGNNVTAIELFLDAGMNINTMFNNRTALYEACISGKEEIVKLLIAKGANINIVNNFESEYTDSGFTPLMESIFRKRGNEEKGKNYPINIIELLLQAKADFEIKVRNCNAMDLAIKYQDRTVVELLKKYGAKEPSKEELDQRDNLIKKQGRKEFKKGMVKSLSTLAIIVVLSFSLSKWVCNGSSSSGRSSSNSNAAANKGNTTTPTPVDNNSPSDSHSYEVGYESGKNDRESGGNSSYQESYNILNSESVKSLDPDSFAQGWTDGYNGSAEKY